MKNVMKSVSLVAILFLSACDKIEIRIRDEPSEENKRKTNAETKVLENVSRQLQRLSADEVNKVLDTMALAIPSKNNLTLHFQVCSGDLSGVDPRWRPTKNYSIIADRITQKQALRMSWAFKGEFDRLWTE